MASTIAEAAQRFRVPPAWIRSVMGVESAGRPRAVSPAGAMGLMQVMPKTYADLRVRYGLGADPFHPHDNVMAGAAYLREMFDRFGAPGFLAAYNAGPARYLQHLAEGRPLPAETRAYVARLTPAVDADAVGEAPAVTFATPIAPPRDTLFVAVSAAPGHRVDRPSRALDAAHAPLFATLSSSEEAR